MNRHTWFRKRSAQTQRSNSPSRLSLLTLEDRLAPAVYYFNGHNIFGPGHQTSDPYWVGDGSAWLNPYNWGKDEGGQLFVGVSVPGGGDTVVFRGATEDGQSWTVFSKQKDGSGNYISSKTFGGSAYAKENEGALTLNLDRNWGGQIVMQDGSTLSIGSGGGRWQSGTIIGNATNAGPLTIQPDPNGTVSTAIGTFVNNGNITQTAGTFRVGGSGGAAPYGGTVINAGTYSMQGGVLEGQLFAEELFQNDGVLTGSSGDVRIKTVTTKTGTIESTGSFNLPSQQIINGGTIRANAGSILNFNTFSAFPIYGSTSWAGNVSIEGGGKVSVTANGDHSSMAFADANFTVASGTTFTVGNVNVAANGLPRNIITGNGKLTSGTITFNSGTMNGSFENDGTVIFAGKSTLSALYEDNQVNGYFQNNGKLLIQAPSVVSNGGVFVNTSTGIVEFQSNSNYFGANQGAGGLIQNLGIMRVADGVNSVVVRAAVDNLDGTIDVRSGSLAITNTYGPASNDLNSPRGKVFTQFNVSHTNSGLSTGGTFNVAKGSTLDLRTGDFFTPGGVFAGTYTGTGGGIVLLGGNMQMAQSEWNFPTGMLVWGDPAETGTSRIIGNWTNRGDLTFPAATTGSLIRSLRYGKLTNRGTLEIGNGVPVYLTEDFQPGIASLINTSEGVITAGNGVLVYAYVPNSPTSDAAIFRNDGTVLFQGGGTVRSFLENYGTVEVHGGVSILNPVPDRTSVVPALVGTWIAKSGGTVAFDPSGRSGGLITSTATLVADGVGSQITGLVAVSKNLGSVTASNGGKIAVVGDLLNQGLVTATDGGKITIGGNFTQTQVGVLTTGIDANSITVSKTATLGGTFKSQVPAGVVPASGFSADVLSANTVSGTFSKQILGGLVSRITDKTVSLNLLTDANDLAVSNVKILPAGGAVTAGTPLSVQFTVSNLSGKATATGWNDAVFLSSDDTLDASDIRLTRQAESGALAANTSRTVTIPFNAPATPGSWVVIVAADSTVAIPDSNRSNNTASAVEPIRITADELPIGINVYPTFPAEGTLFYTITRSADDLPLRISASNAALAVRFAEAPTRDSADVRSVGSPAQLDLPASHGGVYYLAVTRNGAGEVTVRADASSLAITGLGDEQHLSGTIRVNDPITLTVFGTGFTEATTFALGDSAATAVNIQSPNRAVITVSASATGGPQFISATTGNQTVTYSAKGFSAVASDSTAVEWDHLANWNFQIALPGAIRVFREAQVTVTFRNDSATAQPAPLIQVFSDNGRFRLPEGNLLGESMIVLGVKANGRAESYAPGETGSFELVLQPTTFGAHVESSVYAFAVAEKGFTPIASHDPRAGNRTDLPLPAEVVEGFRPVGLSDDVWSAVKVSLQSIVGTTYESYANALRGAANRLTADGVDTHDLNRLNRYLFNVANQFGQISRRFELTAFGRGIENPYDVSATADITGLVTIAHGFNQRLFAPTVSGYTALVPGDRGVLSNRTGGGYVLTEADGSFTTFGPDGHFDFTQNLLGQKTTATYSNGRLTTLTDFRGDTVTLTYSANGRIATITDPVGRVTTYGFDASGEKLTSITIPTGTTSFSYTPDSTGPKAFAIAGITGADGVTIAYEYDAQGRVSRTTIGGQQSVNYEYGAGANVGTVKSTDALSHSLTVAYGEFGQLTAVQTSLMGNIDANFDEAGRLTSLGSVTIGVDANGNSISAIPATGAAVRISYDPAGVRPTAQRDPLGNATTFKYNSAGQLTSQIDPLGTNQYGYDATGNLIAEISPGGRSTNATYDSHGLITQQTYSDGSTTNYTYDSHRNLTSVTDAGPGNSNPKTVIMSYDSADQITLITYPNGKTVGYHYDSAGRQDRITTSDGLTIGYGFDTLGRLQTVSRNAVVEVTYAYDDAGRLETKTFANGTSTVYSYDEMGRKTRIEHRGTNSNMLDFEAYTYSQQGRVETLTTSDGVTTYGYDAVGQLTSVTSPGQSVINYQYDANGNRIGYGANTANEYTTSPTGDAFTYDGDGNLITQTNTTAQSQVSYYYDARGRLYYQSGPAGIVSYEYDPLGNRSAVIINGVRTDLLTDPLGGIDGLGDVLTETTGSAVTSYLQGIGVEARFDSTGAARFYAADLQGSTAVMTDGTGAVTAKYRYDAFGAVTSQTGADAAGNNVRFNGQLGVTDRGTGLLDMRNRFYDPALGRFTQQDPLGLGGADSNLYRYSLNNPVLLADPSGLNPLLGALGGFESVTTVVFPATSGYFLPIVSGFGNALQQSGLALSPTGIPSTGAVFGNPTFFVAPLNFAPAAPAMTAGAFVSGVVAPLVVTGGAVIYTIKTVRDAGFDEGNRPGPGPEITPDFLNRLDHNYGNDPIYKHILDVIAKDPQHPTLDEKLEAARILNNHRNKNEHPKGTTQQVTANDPNDIVGPAGYGPAGYIQPIGEFPYIIHFQNQPTATAPAQVVTVTQQLDTDFDWSTLTLQSFGWGSLQFNVPAGLQNYHTTVTDTARNALVDVDAKFNPATGFLAWTLTTLDPITFDQPLDSVTAGFLPPDDANGVGQGFISYTVRPKANASTGTRYDAQARIVFDTEAPLDTQPIFNTADSGKPTATVSPLPATSSASHTVVHWGGTDDANGSGVAQYDVYVSVDGGAFAIWKAQTTDTSAIFSGTAGQTISFYAVNSDNVGLTYPTPADAQATTKLSDAAGSGSPLLTGSREFSVGSNSSINFYNPDGTLRSTLTPFPNFTGGIRTASADFNGDGIADFVVGTGPGNATHVKIFDGVSQAEMFSIDPFEASFTGGVFVAAGDINGDGKAELAISPDEGGGPRVRVFNGNGFTQIADFFGIDDPNFRGGARAAIGDMNGDGKGDLIVAAGFGGGPRVAAFDGSQLTGNGGPKLFGDFFAFETGLRNGIFVAAGDVNGDGFADLVAGGGPGGGPRVYILDGKSLVQTGSDSLVPIGNFFAGDTNNRGGVRVAVKNLDNDSKADVVTGSGTAAGSRVTAYFGSNISAASGTPSTALDFDAFAGFTGGVFVG